MTIQTYPKKRLSIIIETPFLKRLSVLLDDLGIAGYTVLPALAGKGKNGTWTQDTQSSDAGTMVQVLIVLDESRVEEVLDATNAVLKRQMGIVTLSDVEVLRPELF